jgi:glycosyltransferase involved in cell wall biosynthesis
VKDVPPTCELILPCRDEAPALLDLLPRVPADIAVLVVDNGSTDATAEVAAAHGATVVPEASPGYGAAVHDIAPMRVVQRADLLALDVRDRRFGYPLELLVKAADAGWRVVEHDVAYHPRAAGTRSKVSGSVRGTARAAHDFWRVLP